MMALSNERSAVINMRGTKGTSANAEFCTCALTRLGALPNSQRRRPLVT